MHTINENLLSVAHIPMMSFLMCWCLEWDIETKLENHSSRTITTEDLPVTITELYSKVVKVFEMKHNLKSEYRTKTTEEFKVPPVVEKTLDKLSKLAAKTIVKNKVIFQEDYLKKFDIEAEDVEELKVSGLLTCGPGFRETPFKITRNFCFSHLTFQEYFAALEFVRNSQIPPEMEFGEEMVFQFMAGVLHEKKNKQLMELVFTCVRRSWDILLAAKCLYEYQDEEFGIEMIHKHYHLFHETLSCGNEALSEVDCVAVSFFLTILSKSCKAYALQLLATNSLKCNIQTATETIRIVKSLKDKFCPIIYLDCSINDECLASLSEHLRSTKINKLGLSISNRSDKGLQYLSQALPSTKIITLDLSGTMITDVGLQHLSQALPSTIMTTLMLKNIKNISTKCLHNLVEVLPKTMISTLDFSCTNLPASAVTHLYGALLSTRITRLCLSGDYLRCEICKTSHSPEGNTFFLNCDKAHIKNAPLQFSDSGHVLSTSTMYDSDIDPTGFVYLSQALPSTNITKLDLSGTQISDVALQHLSQALPSTKITTLDLSWTQITDVALQHLSQALPSTKITTLDLRGTRITNLGFQHLSQAIPSTKNGVLRLDYLNPLFESDSESSLV